MWEIPGRMSINAGQSKSEAQTYISSMGTSFLTAPHPHMASSSQQGCGTQGRSSLVCKIRRTQCDKIQ